MARKILNRKELREAADAAERVELDDEQEIEESAEDDEEEELEEKKPAKKAVRRKTRAKVAKEVRLKAFWGVFNQALSQVAQFEYNQRDDAVKKAQELTESKKTPHFVQLVKKVIEE